MKKTFLLLLCLASLHLSTLVASADDAARAAAILPGSTVIIINQDVPSQGAMAAKLKSLSQNGSFFSSLSQKVPSNKSGRSACSMINALRDLSKENKECKSLYMQISTNYPQSNDICAVNELNKSITLDEIKKEITEQATKAGQKPTFKDGASAGIPFIEVTIEENSDAIAVVGGGKTVLAAPANVLAECLKRYQAKQSVALSDKMTALRATAKIPATAIAQVLVDITPEMQKKLVEKANDAENPMMGAAMDPCSKLTGFAMSLSLEESALALNLLFQAGNPTDASAFKTQFLDGMVLPMLPTLAPMLGITTPLDFVTNLKAAQDGNLTTLTTAFTPNDIDTIAKIMKQFASMSQE